MTDEHFDQLAPIDGVHQVQPDGSITPAPPVLPLNATTEERDAFLARRDLRPDSGLDEVQPPSIPLEYQDEGFQRSVSEQVAAQRAQLAQPAGNIGPDGAPHFLRLVDGSEVCGQDGQPWPCDQAQAMAASARQAEFGEWPGGVPVEAPKLVTLEEAALAAGMNPTELSAIMEAQKRRRS